MDARAALLRLGGSGSAPEILALTSRRRLQRALTAGDVTRLRRGRYALVEGLSHGTRAADELGGVMSHLSAAEQHGWALKCAPRRPWITVPRGRHTKFEARATAHVLFADLPAHDVARGLTSPLRTVIDCARHLPFDEALAVADSALRVRDVTSEELELAAARLRGKGAAQCRRIVANASGLAANPFESVLRAITLEFSEFDFKPQLEISAGDRLWHPDLVDAANRVVLEADSFTFHTSRVAHGRDCVRYNALSLAGWLVLRFTWEQVMHSPNFVRSVLSELSAYRSAPNAINAWPGPA